MVVRKKSILNFSFFHTNFSHEFGQQRRNYQLQYLDLKKNLFIFQQIATFDISRDIQLYKIRLLV